MISGKAKGKRQIPQIQEIDFSIITYTVPGIPPPEFPLWLERFIWEFANGSVKNFAAKVSYHPNRISALKATTEGISARLVRRIIKSYKLTEKERAFWAKRLLNV